MADRMTAQDARSFDGYSNRNAMLIMSQLDCECKPYEEVFTYARWKAQGMQVQKGQRGLRIPTITAYEVEDKETGEVKTRSRKHTSVVFCKCQVAEGVRTQYSANRTAKETK